MRIELIHPVMVHFTVGLLVTGVLIGLAGAALHRQQLIWAGHWALWIGACFGAAAVVTGLIAGDRIPETGPLGELVETHETFGFTTLGVFAAVAAGWLLVTVSGWKRLAPWLHGLGLAGVVLIGVTGFYGGRLVYDKGVAVEINGVPAWTLGLPRGGETPRSSEKPPAAPAGPTSSR